MLSTNYNTFLSLPLFFGKTSEISKAKVLSIALGIIFLGITYKKFNNSRHAKIVKPIALGIILVGIVYKKFTKARHAKIEPIEEEAKLESASSVSKQLNNVVIIGGGMSGLTTAIFAGQEKLSPVVIMGDNSEAQLPLIKQITNFVGHKDGISGQQLLMNTTFQAQKFGACLVAGQVNEVDLSSHPYKLTLTDGNILFSKTIVIATGTYQKKLGFASETSLRGRGVFASATRDAFLCKNKHVIVVGGGNSAMGEALELSKFANKITIVYETTVYASPTICDQVIRTGKVTILENSLVTDIYGQESVSGIMLKNLRTGISKFLPAGGIFVSNGRPVNTFLLKGKLDMDDEGVIRIHSGRTGSSFPGVFVVGDARRSLKYRKLLAAAGDGTEAAIDVKEYLAKIAK